jgi:hypothetical protein
MIDKVKKAMTRKVYRYLDNVVRIINIWSLDDDFVSYFKDKLDD